MDRRRFWVSLLAFIPGAVAGRCLADWISVSKDPPKKIPVLPWKPIPSGPFSYRQWLEAASPEPRKV